MPSNNTRGNINRRTVLKSTAVGGIAFLAGCSDGEAPAADDGTSDGDSKHWIGAQGSEAPNYNVFRITDTTSSNRVSRVMDPAYVFDENDDIVYRLVRDIDVSDDFTEFTFTLTEYGEWSDPYGQMTAEDWVYSITEIIQGEDNWAAVSMDDDFRMGVDEVPSGFEPADEDGDEAWFNVEETGEFEFTIETPEPYPSFLEEPIIWGFQEVVPRELAEPYVEDRDGDGLNEDDEIQNLAYTGNLGAFTPEVLETEARMYAPRNDDYYLRNYDGHEDSPHIDEWTYQVMREESTRLSAIQSGEITNTGIPARRADEFEERDDVQIIGTPTVYCQSMFYNMRSDGWDALDTAEVRQALTMAVDRESIVEDIQYGYGTVAHTLQPEYSEFYDDSQVVQWDYDPDSARERLEENLPSAYGYSDGRVVDGDGEEVVLDFVFSDSAEATEITARYIQDELDENLGLAVELEPVPWNSMLNEFFYTSPAEARDWDLMAGIGRNSYPRAPEATESYWRATDEPWNTANAYGYDDPHGIADILTESAQETDPEARQENLAEVYGILSEEQPWNFLYFPEDLNGYRAHVEPTEDPSISWGYDIHRWEIEAEQ
ncbi:peptide/nickel transport system substrate-binding protein [Natronobacterium texcoconense]|uniref:Peptide/nickel transport system substrate-binding protein n=1 Tax=Natronobacterium texcoconense TaxID=1095778 RepID=A0A1H0ZL44_NATTX|nr:peptide/nickel transport system substrate-binding protein [Natronobacterium texcoconense]